MGMYNIFFRWPDEQIGIKTDIRVLRENWNIAEIKTRSMFDKCQEPFVLKLSDQIKAIL